MLPTANQNIAPDSSNKNLQDLYDRNSVRMVRSLQVGVGRG